MLKGVNTGMVLEIMKMIGDRPVADFNNEINDDVIKTKSKVCQTRTDMHILF
jgi:hypothetical protein